MLQPVLDPFHRPARDARRDRHQHDVGKHALLDAEAAAGIRRRAQPQPVARHLQRARHHRMHAERPLEIREHVVGVLAADRIRRPRRRSRSACRNCADSGPRPRSRCAASREGALRVAVAERAVARDIAPSPSCSTGASGSSAATGSTTAAAARSRPRSDRARPRRGSGLPRPPPRPARRHSARDRPRSASTDRRLARRRRRLAEALVTSAPVMHGGDAARMARAASRADRADHRMRMRRAQDRGMQRAGRHAEIVDVAAAPGQQVGVLHPLDRLAAPAGVATAMSLPVPASVTMLHLASHDQARDTAEALRPRAGDNRAAAGSHIARLARSSRRARPARGDQAERRSALRARGLCQAARRAARDAVSAPGRPRRFRSFPGSFRTATGSPRRWASSRPRC